MKTFALLLSTLALTASTASAVEQTSWGQVKQQLAPAAKAVTTTTESSAALMSSTSTSITTTAADLSATETRSTTLTVDPKGGSLQVNDPNDGATTTDDLQVKLIVPQKAVTQPVSITMTVIGNTLSDLIIAFQPGGLVFNSPATLQVQLGGNLVDQDVSTLQVWHQYADGTVDIIELVATKSKKDGFTYLTLSVPGFSRYSLRK